MERESNPMQALCRSGCGFYGNPATDGLCSLCFKEALKKKQQPPVSAPSPSSVSNVPARSSFMETATAQPTVPCLPTPIVPASEHQPAEIMSRTHIPAENIKDRDKSSNSTNGNAQVQGGSDDPEAARSANSEDGDEAITVEGVFDAHSSDRVESVAVDVGIFKIPEDSANAGSSVEQPDNDNSDKEDKDAKKKKNRCAVCRKKVGLTGFECRCGGLFCAVHRYSDKHDCSFNYREMGAQEIRRNNPVVVGEKIQKI